MKHIKIESHIDGRIMSKLWEGKTLSEVIDSLKDGVERFSQRESYMDLDRGYILKNWSKIDIRIKYTSYYVSWSKKRIEDIENIIEIDKNSNRYDHKQLFKLIKFKEKLRNGKGSFVL